jgi:hypothetical protein
MQKSETIGELAAALAKAQGQLKGAIRGSENPFYHSTYADLAAGWDACREALSANELAVIQSPNYDYEHNLVTVETLICHSSSEWQSSSVSAIPVKEINEYIDGKKTTKEVESRTPQAIGSCITYLRRYALFATVGIAPEDDDGNVASGKPPVGTKEAADYVAEQKLAAMKAKQVEDKIVDKFGSKPTVGKSAEEFAKEHGEKQTIGVTGIVGSVSDTKESKRGAKYITAKIGETQVYVYHEHLRPQFLVLKGKEIAVKCTKSMVGEREFFNVEEIIGETPTTKDIPF